MQNWSKQTDHELWSAPTLALKSPRMNSSSSAGIPLMVVASLSFAFSGDDRFGVWLEWPDPLMDGVLATKFPCICRRWIPAAKKVKFLSLTDPESGSLVSWRATMSICSLVSSISMIAVLRASSISCRSSEKRGVNVLTFWVPSL